MNPTVTNETAKNGPIFF